MFINYLLLFFLGKNNTHDVYFQNVTTAPLQSSGFSTHFIIGMVAAYSVIILVALFGNSFGLFVVLKKSSSKSATNLFIANMAVADLLLTFTMMPLSIVFLYSGNLWFGGTLSTIICKALFYVIPISISASVFTIAFISVDRLYAIFYPFKEKIFQKPKFLSAIIWILSIVLMIPYVFLLQVKYDPITDAYYCKVVPEWPWEDPNDLSLEETSRALKTFHIVVFITLYALPLLVTVTNYSLICRKLWLRKIPGHVTNGNRASAEKSKRKVVRLLVTVCVVFALCWFPVYVNHYFWYVRPDQVHLLSEEVKVVFLLLAHANSAMNPCIYLLLNSNFRQTFFATLMCHPEVVSRPLQPQAVQLILRTRSLQLEQHNRQQAQGPVIEGPAI